MPFDDFKIAVNYNNSAGLVNVETYFKVPPRSVRVPIGALTRISLSGIERTDGEILIAWRYGAMKFARLNTFITTIFGNYTTQTKQVTIRTRLRDNTFANYNAIAYLPLDGTDYVNITTSLVRDLQLRFRIIGVAS